MKTNISMVVRMGNTFKISRIIHSVEDANIALHDVWDRFEHYKRPGTSVTWKVTQNSNSLTGRQSVDNCTLPDALCGAIGWDIISLVNKDGVDKDFISKIEIQLCTSTPTSDVDKKPEESVNKQFPWQELESQTSEIWNDADELFQLCDLLHHYLMRMKAWNENDARIQVLLEPIFNTKDMLQRRSMKIRDSAKAINSWPDTYLLAA